MPSPERDITSGRREYYLPVNHVWSLDEGNWFTISMFSCGNCNSWYSSFITFCLVHIHKKVLEHLFTTPSVPLNMTELYYSFCFWIKQAVEATNNVVLGNKELSQAIQRNSSSRTFLLLFLFVLTFSVLFLDWYSWFTFFLYFKWYGWIRHHLLCMNFLSSIWICSRMIRIQQINVLLYLYHFLWSRASRIWYINSTPFVPLH